jgi:hypothetical protein
VTLRTITAHPATPVKVVGETRRSPVIIPAIPRDIRERWPRQATGNPLREQRRHASVGKSSPATGLGREVRGAPRRCSLAPAIASASPRSSSSCELGLRRSKARSAGAVEGAVPDLSSLVDRQARSSRHRVRHARLSAISIVEAVISGHRESPPVQRIPHHEAPEVTGGDSSRQLPITRNEGVRVQV